jgi:hypothetical protein
VIFVDVFSASFCVFLRLFASFLRLFRVFSASFSFNLSPPRPQIRWAVPQDNSKQNFGFYFYSRLLHLKSGKSGFKNPDLARKNRRSVRAQMMDFPYFRSRKSAQMVYFPAFFISCYTPFMGLLRVLRSSDTHPNASSDPLRPPATPPPPFLGVTKPKMC